MLIKLSISGYLKTFFHQDAYELQLAEPANLTDLFLAIDKEFGETLPAAIWSREKQKFRGPVSVLTEGKMISDPHQPLADGQHIVITRLLIGG